MKRGKGFAVAGTPKKQSAFIKEIKRNKVLYLMIFPAVLFMFIFSYIPMGGVIVAFKDYNYAKGMFGSEWVGLDNFKVFWSSGKMLLLTKNTLLYNLAFLFIGTVVKIIFAIFISEMIFKRYAKTLQSFMMLPHFLSWVIVGGLAYNLLSYEFGAINQILVSLGLERIDVYNNSGVWKYILTFVDIWKNSGYGMIFYLAAITGINPDLNEAAVIDGCGLLQRIRYITLPLIMPTTCVMILLNLGNVLKGNLDMFYQLVGANSNLYNATDVIDTYVYRSLTKFHDYGITSAAGLYQGIIGCVLVLTVNYVIKRIDPDYALF